MWKYVTQIVRRLEHFKTRITLHNLGIHNLTIPEYSRLFATRSFYDNIPTETLLRKKSKMLHIINSRPYRGEPEDVYFCSNPLYKPTVEGGHAIFSGACILSKKFRVP
jgi:hypothetical protein